MSVPPRTKCEYLRELVAGKNHWNRPLTDEEKAFGFLGWHERGFLPHCDYPDLVQFITFRLEDSMPASRCGEWEYLLAIENVREKRAKLEEYLDQGIGDCWLHDTRIAKLTEEALLHFHNERYEMLAWCVMPNHVHALVHVWHMPLWKIIQNWKIHTSNELRRRKLLERRAPPRHKDETNQKSPRRCSAFQSFWQREYWDTFMRDEKQERTAIRYIENNPVRAKLCRTGEEWPFSSAKFRDKFNRLLIPGQYLGAPCTVTANPGAPYIVPAQ